MVGWKRLSIIDIERSDKAVGLHSFYQRRFVYDRSAGRYDQDRS